MKFSTILLSNYFTEGGTLMMSLILICLLLSIFFLVMGFLTISTNNIKSKKMLRLAVDSSLLGLVLGFLGSVLGLISAFDTIEAIGNPDPSVFAAGLKISLITATFGLLTFVIARVGILILKGFQKE
ncbi:MotA/TolQ/ExbB proton channel family protein [Lacinutrix salivirga]